MKKERLTYDEKELLSLYKEVFKKEYNYDYQSKINMQNLCYLLQLEGVTVCSDFGFSWDQNERNKE